MKRQRTGGAFFVRREWTIVFGLLAAAAGLLFASGYTVAGGIAFALCAAGYALRKRERRQS